MKKTEVKAEEIQSTNEVAHNQIFEGGEIQAGAPVEAKAIKGAKNAKISGKEKDVEDKTLEDGEEQVDEKTDTEETA